MSPALRLPDGWRAWHNRVPDWIARHPAVVAPPRGRHLSAAGARLVVQAMADQGTRDPAGNLVNIVGGHKLARAAGMTRRVLNRYITHLADAGAVVVLSRGGVLGLGQDAKKHSVANIYGMPATPGALDQRAVRRRAQTMKPTGELNSAGRAKYVPDVSRPGTQTTLWPQPEQPSPAEAGYTTPGQIAPQHTRTWGGIQQDPPTTGSPQAPGREPPRRPPKTPHPRDTTPVSPGHYRNVRGTHLSSLETIPGAEDGLRTIPDGRSRGGPSEPDRGRWRKRAMPAVQTSDLTDTARLLELYRLCVGRRLVGPGEHDRHRFVAAAVSALKVRHQTPPGDPAAVFGANVIAERWLFITGTDEDAAKRILIDHDRRQHHHPSPPPSEPPAPPAAAPSDDTKWLKAAASVAGQTGGDPYRFLQAKLGWTRDRFNAAMRDAADHLEAAELATLSREARP